MTKVATKKKTAKKPARICHDWRTDFGYKRLTRRKLRDVLLYVAECGNVSEACRRAKCNRKAVHAKAARDDEFNAAFREAIYIGRCGLEDDSHDLALYGYEEPVFYEGEVCGTKRKYPIALRIFLLKAHDPEKYRERYDVSLGNAPGGAPLSLEVIMDPLAVAELAR